MSITLNRPFSSGAIFRVAPLLDFLRYCARSAYQRHNYLISQTHRTVHTCACTRLHVQINEVVLEFEEVRTYQTTVHMNNPDKCYQSLLVDQADQIKAAMSGFSLPSSAIPEWAKHIPENIWKSKLIDGIRTKDDDS